MAPYLITKTENIPHTTICGKGYVILEHYMPRENTVTSATYADLLKNHLRPAVKSKRRGRFSKGVLHQHDNARPILPVQLLQQSIICPLSVFHIRRTRQTSPPCDCHVFGPLKVAMGGKSFRSDEEVQQAVHEGQPSQSKDFFSRGIHRLPKRWNICMERNGDYIEKLCHCVPFVFTELRDKKYLMFSFDSPS